MTSTGDRDTLIRIERDSGVGKDAHGGKIEDWQPYVSEWASVRFGSAQERREAAQEQATQTATFYIDAHSKTRAITPRDRIAGYLGTAWDIIGAVPSRDEIEITAVRKAA